MTQHIREPAVANRFYPGDRAKLENFLDRVLDTYSASSKRHLTRAIIVPHAGYSYSGETAAHAFSLIDSGSFERVVILGPSHHIGFHGISIAPYEKYRTPLGDIDVDVHRCRDLVESNTLFTQREDAHRHEHSIEVELPFIQRLLPNCRIIPLVTGDLSLEQACEIARELRRSFIDDTLFVISSDFTHYGQQFRYTPFPIQLAPDKLKELDAGAIKHILNCDAKGFFDYVESTGATICGRIPVTILLALFSESDAATEQNLLHYTNSGSMIDDYTASVSYAAISMSLTPSAHSLITSTLSSMNDRRLLLKLARDSIRTRLEGRIFDVPENLRRHLYDLGSVFVTLHIENRLRGCIGTIAAKEPLVENVIRNAEKAAFEDPRFPPLTEEELGKVDLEISYLIPPKPIQSISEFIIGKHGIILEKDKHRAVFLPQVAIEQGWDKEATMENLSEKAGLSPSAWRKRDVRFSVFETVCFNDSNGG